MRTYLIRVLVRSLLVREADTTVVFILIAPFFAVALGLSPFVALKFKDGESVIVITIVED